MDDKKYLWRDRPKSNVNELLCGYYELLGGTDVLQKRSLLLSRPRPESIRPRLICNPQGDVQAILCGLCALAAADIINKCSLLISGPRREGTVQSTLARQRKAHKPH